MPAGKSLSFVAGEYPELDGIESGAKIEVSGTATVNVNEDGSGEIVFDSMEIETEGIATKELKGMTMQDGVYAGGGQAEQESTF